MIGKSLFSELYHHVKLVDGETLLDGLVYICDDQKGRSKRVVFFLSTITYLASAELILA